MSNLKLTEITIYPVKSLGGISLNSAITEKRGLQYDRRWMIVDVNNKFISQRELPEMALISCSFSGDSFRLSHKKNPMINFQIPFEIKDGKAIEVMVWSDRCDALHWSEEADAWLSEVLHHPCKLVYMPDSTTRNVEPEYGSATDITSFSDGYPFLIIGEATLAELNDRLDDKIPMNRFRPNFVFSGGAPFEEDNWGRFTIGSSTFKAVKPCGRCMITTINQDTAISNKEPLATLSSYRKKNNKVLFGQNLLIEKLGTVQLGDSIIFDVNDNASEA